MTFNLGELFCGPGGIAIGANMSSVRHNNELYSIVHQWSNDIDKDTCQTYINNICPDNAQTVVCCDVRQLDFSSLAPISALAFGFPCNDFSTVGEQKGINGDYGPLYSYGVNALEIFQPDWFVAENVSGLQSSNGGKAFEMILNALSGANYNIYPHLYKFEDYGVPQARHRVIIVGIRKNINLNFHIPSPTHVGRRVTCAEAICFPPITETHSNNDFTKQSKHVIERLSYIKPGQNVFNANMPERLRLNVKGAKISQIYKRLDPNKPAYTVTGSGGGGTHMYHWVENRALTNRERARLQTFPDDFVFYGSKESVRKQIGMAVPPLGIRIILESILKTFAGVQYESVIQNITYDNQRFI